MPNENTPDYYEEAICACGKGKVIKPIYLVEKNDWAGYNKYEGDVEISCPDCSKKYNYKRITKAVSRKDPGHGAFETRDYLVLNESDINDDCDDYIGPESCLLEFIRM